MTGIILAGGRSDRMGQNKAFLSLDGRTLISIVGDLFRRLFPEVIIVTNSPREYLQLDAHLVTDMYVGRGALGGIYSGLFFSSYPFAFVSACDMPFIREEAIQQLIGLKEGFDVVIPERETGVEPMHAVYSKNCLKPIRSQLDQNNLKIIDFFPQVRVRKVPAQALAGWEDNGLLFFNINSPQDLHWAEEHVLRRRETKPGGGSPFPGKTL